MNQPDPLLTTERVVFYFLGFSEGRLSLGVEIPEGQPLKTESYAGLPSRALERYPDMIKHRCANGRSLGVREEFTDTEVAHFAEHILIEELVQEGADRGELRGETIWRFATTGWGRYTVRIDGVPAGLDHRAVALRAVRAVWSLIGA